MGDNKTVEDIDKMKRLLGGTVQVQFDAPPAQVQEQVQQIGDTAPLPLKQLEADVRRVVNKHSHAIPIVDLREIKEEEEKKPGKSWIKEIDLDAFRKLYNKHRSELLKALGVSLGAGVAAGTLYTLAKNPSIKRLGEVVHQLGVAGIAAATAYAAYKRLADNYDKWAPYIKAVMGTKKMSPEELEETEKLIL